MNVLRLRSVAGAPSREPVQGQSAAIARVITTAFVVIAVAPATADTIHVPGDVATVQLAIDGAMPGDEIIVSPGTYEERINFLGKAIIVRCVDPEDPDVVAATILRGDGVTLQSVVSCISGEGADSILSGFTITNGLAERGGGMNNVASSPTVTHCTFTCNNALKWGGGMSNLDHSNPTVAHCSFIGNSVVYDSPSGGGGMSNIDHCDPIVTDCTFMNNEGLSGGGLYYENQCDGQIIDCIIAGNVALSGGGLSMADVGTVIRNCTLVDNTAANWGGAMLLEILASPSISNCIISQNTADVGAGICDLDNAAMFAANCLITGNVARIEGGGLYEGNGGHSEVQNSIFWGNAPDQVFNDGGVLGFVYCDVQGGFEGAGNIDVDPIFIDPDGPDNDPSTFQDNDYRLAPGSPCIDAADNTVYGLQGVRIDLDGNPRFVDDPDTRDTGNPDGVNPIVDMGPFEAQTPSCPADISDDDTVGPADLAIILGNWGPVPPHDPAADLNDDGVVGPADLAIVLGSWGPCP